MAAPSLHWAAVRERYADGATVRPLRGGSHLQVVEVDDEKVCLKQRLWRDCVTRTQLETAVDLLGDRPLPADAVTFAEELRAHYSTGPEAITDCTRIPNLSAVVLLDLGYLTS